MTPETPDLEPFHAAACLRIGEISDLGQLDRIAESRSEDEHRASEKGSASRSSEPLLEVAHLTKEFRIADSEGLRRETLVAVNDVSFNVRRGEALGIVGESGSGKSTLARCLLWLIEPTRGDVLIEGQSVRSMSSKELRRLRSRVQMIFQDPGSSIDPRLRIKSVLQEPLRIHGLWGQEGFDEAELKRILDLVRLPASSLERYPHEFSGGQRQRIAIARALALKPSLLVCDEPVSSLDVSVQADIVNLLSDLREQLELSLVFVAHDLPLVRFLCDRIGVMYEGELVEEAEAEQLFTTAEHKHTLELIAAQPSLIVRGE